MRIHATINERTVRRTFKERKPGSRGLTVIDRDLPRFGLTVAKNGTKTFSLRPGFAPGRSAEVGSLSSGRRQNKAASTQTPPQVASNLIRTMSDKAGGGGA